MSHLSIDPMSLKRALARVGENFVTKDVSEQTTLKGEHGALSTHSHWHAFVGKALRYHEVAIGIQYLDAGASRGARWCKTITTMRGEARPDAAIHAPTAPAAVTVECRDDAVQHDVEVGPQYAGDSTFTARMRLHQSHYRATVLGVPFGRGPNAADASFYGNMLDPVSGQAGLNFLTPGIFATVKARLRMAGGTLEPYRLLHNMLSSQPMCFNLFGPLVDAPKRATRMLGALVNDKVAQVLHVAIEWAPAPAHEYLDDRTAFDARFEYERLDGTRVAVGVETKLTDTFSQKPYDGEKYRRWMRGARSPFRPECAVEVATSRYNQLWRNHLLAIALRDHRTGAWDEVRSAVIHHRLDMHGTRVIEDYRALLQPGDTSFVPWTLDKVVDAFESAAIDADERRWLAAFRSRYLDLSASQPKLGIWHR